MGQLKGTQFNMTEPIPGGFMQKYDDPLVSHTTAIFEQREFTETHGDKTFHLVESKNGVITIYFHSGKTVSFPAPVESVYNITHGLPISSEHGMLFLGTWDKGLLCYDIYTGKRIWKYPRGAIGRILILSDSLVVVRAHKEILKLDIKTGQIIDRIGSSEIFHLFDLGNGYAFASKIRGKACLFDPKTFAIIKKYDEKLERI